MRCAAAAGVEWLGRTTLRAASGNTGIAAVGVALLFNAQLLPVSAALPPFAVTLVSNPNAPALRLTLATAVEVVAALVCSTLFASRPELPASALPLQLALVDARPTTAALALLCSAPLSSFSVLLASRLTLRLALALVEANAAAAAEAMTFACMLPMLCCEGLAGGAMAVFSSCAKKAAVPNADSSVV